MKTATTSRSIRLSNGWEIPAGSEFPVVESTEKHVVVDVGGTRAVLERSDVKVR
jgi:hypothetical protein